MENKYWVIILCIVFYSQTAFAQSDKNYIEQIDVLKAYSWDGEIDLSYDDSILHRKSRQYYDDLGRPSVSAKGGLTLNGSNVFSLVTYDQLGRKSKEFVPFAGGRSQEYVSEDELLTQSSLSLGDAHGYCSYTYDALGNLSSSTGAGKVWHENNKCKTTRYIVNQTNSVRKYCAPADVISLVDSGYYEAGTLMGEVFEDEDGIRLETYKDLLGNIVLERRNGNNDTYYVYNDNGELRYVLSPQYQNSRIKAMYVFEYRYDTRGNIVKSIEPGCSFTEYWYNSENQLVFIQDATLRERNLYRFMLYDEFGRLAIQGVCVNPQRRGSTNSCVFTGSPDSFCSTGYVLSLPEQFADATLEVVNYYDTYEFLKSLPVDYSSLSDSLTIADSNIATTFKTGVFQLASNGKAMLSVMYYDHKGNVTDSRSILLDEHLVTTHTDYTFTDDVEQCITKDYRLQKDQLVSSTSILLRNHYDEHTGLLKSSNLRICLPSGVTKEQTFQSISYDGIGRIKEIAYGGNAGKVSYEYNIRNQITSILGSNFMERLSYVDGLGTPYYNGNISCQQWKTSNESFMRGYKFSYDGLNRLLSARYGEREDMSNHLNRYNEDFVYNANGCIRKLQRRGKKDDGEYGKIDNLSINLNGNLLYSVTDDANPVNSYASMDFKDKLSENQEYYYNGVGSLVSDVNKGISHIKYDNLNYPLEIQFSNGGIIQYVYAPDGTKLRTSYITAVENIVVPINTTLPLQPSQILSEDSIDYLGEIIYKNGELDKCLFGNGYVSLDGDSPLFHYFMKDHLGNVRTVTNEQGILEQVTHYYPFGGIFSDAGLNLPFQPYKFGTKKLDRMHGLDWYDFGARMYDPVLGTWTSVDPMAGKHRELSPFSYCNNNPVNGIDPDGNDWYTSKNGTYLWNPCIKSQYDLRHQKGYTYVGETHTDLKNGTYYRKDGSILFSNEQLAYHRMWYMSRKFWRSNYLPAGREEAAFLLKNGKVLVLPDNWNDSMTAKMCGYEINGNRIQKGKETYQIVGHVHTHPDRSLDQGASGQDQKVAANHRNIPFYILHGNGNIYGYFYNYKGDYKERVNDDYIDKVEKLLNGKLSLIKQKNIILK